MIRKVIFAGTPDFAATALRPVVRLGADLAHRLAVPGGEPVRVSTDAGSIELLAVVGGVSDGVVWLPECSAGSTVRQTLGAHHGSSVVVSLATRTANDTENDTEVVR